MKIVGIDEVGRGCWAGPLVAGAVLLDEPMAGLKDSKQLSAQRREALAMQIETEAVAFGLGWVWPATIDKIGLTAAVETAMAAALRSLKIEYDSVIIDGNYNFLAHVPKTEAIIKADALIPAVSAASILAKVARDHYMQKLAVELPDYGFESHVGYGTVKHLAALQAYGVTDHHRMSYKPVKALLQ